MDFKTFRTLYDEATEYTDIDHYIMERGWQDWMNDMSVDTVAAVLKKIYEIAKAPNRWEAIKSCFKNLKALAMYTGIPYSTLQKWSLGENKPTEYMLMMLTFIVISDMTTDRVQDDE